MYAAEWAKDVLALPSTSKVNSSLVLSTLQD